MDQSRQKIGKTKQILGPVWVDGRALEMLSKGSGERLVSFVPDHMWQMIERFLPKNSYKEKSLKSLDFSRHLSWSSANFSRPFMA